MASYLHKTIFIALILAIIIPISSARYRIKSKTSNDVVQQLRDHCSESDSVSIADCTISVAMQKAEVFSDELNKWYKDTNDVKWKEKYLLCSKNFIEVDRNLKLARRSLDSDDYRIISDQIDDAREELDNCKCEIGPGLFEPGHVVDRNNELGLYLIFARAATGRLYWL